MTRIKLLFAFTDQISQKDKNTFILFGILEVELRNSETITRCLSSGKTKRLQVMMDILESFLLEYMETNEL